MKREERYHQVLDFFRREAGPQTTELEFGSAFQLLCATLLSAQCTDRRVNAITPALFARFPDARDLVEMARMLTDLYGGEVPSEAAELVKLPGVGRKTANVVQAVWFGRPTLAVDTHVYRVSHRLGLVPESADTPRKVEDYLMAHIPEEEVADAHHWLLLHGRYVCQSARPKCGECPFDGFCPKRMKGSKLR